MALRTLSDTTSVSFPKQRYTVTFWKKVNKRLGIAMVLGNALAFFFRYMTG